MDIKRSHTINIDRSMVGYSEIEPFRSINYLGVVPWMYYGINEMRTLMGGSDPRGYNNQTLFGGLICII